MLVTPTFGICNCQITAFEASRSMSRSIAEFDAVSSSST